MLLSSLYYFSSELFLIISILLLSFYGIYYSTLKTQDINYPILSVEFLYLIIFVLLLYFFLSSSYNALDVLLYSNNIEINGYNYFVKEIITFLVIFILFISRNYLKYERYNNFEYFLLFLFLVLSAVTMLYANNFITLYLGIEFQNFVFYILLAYNNKTKRGLEASLKYFILASFMSILFLFGISIIYGMIGSFNFIDIQLYFIVLQQYFSLILENYCFIFYTLFLGFLLIFLLFFFKLTIAPFQYWAVDIYSSMSLINLLLFMVISKFIFFSILVKLIFVYFYKFFFFYNKLFFICSLLSIIIGAVGGISEFNIKKIFTYSSINNMGFIILAVSFGTFEGLQMAFFYFFIYIIMSLLFFVILFSIKKDYRYLEFITDLKDFQKINKSIAYTFSILLFSLSGIPPLLGFWGKFFILMELASSFYYKLIVILLLVNMLSIYYYLRFVKLIFFENTTVWKTVTVMTYQNGVVSYILLFFIVFGFFNLDILLNFSYLLSIQLFI
jgi:NADH-quinone oxidoreductase subunit N